MEKETEQCLYCSTLYKTEKSTAQKQVCFCSTACEKVYTDNLKEPLNFI
jgi:hypothetical protein